MSTPTDPAPESNPLISVVRQHLHAILVTEYQFEQDARFIRAFRDSTPDLLLELRADGTLLDLNHPPGANLFHPTSEVLQRNMAELLPVAAARNLQRAIDNTLREKKLTQCAWTLPLDEQEHHFEVRVAYLRSDRVLAIVRDITAQQQALDQLREFPRQLLNAQEQERSRLARDLHDEIGQALTAIILTVAHAQPGATPAAQRDLAEAKTMLETLSRQIRHLAHELYPSILQDLGLTEALSELVGRFTRQLALQVKWQLPDATLRFSAEVELAAYRIVQEAITNVARHAAAQSVMVSVRAQPDRLLIQVVDDGQGFDLAAINPAESYGLSNMRERAKLLGGTFRLETAPGDGTRLAVELPLIESHAREEST
jgi:signal transduction histidine kinase